MCVCGGGGGGQLCAVIALFELLDTFFELHGSRIYHRLSYTGTLQ